MGNRQANGLLQGICQLAAARAAQQSDGQLLERFAAHRDEGAFAALLQRHGGLVYGVCRNVLRNDADAEDAFQATFLVLAKKARAIREERAVGGWLHRVAFRVAMKARRAADRRRQQESQAQRPAEVRSGSEMAWRELQAL